MLMTYRLTSDAREQMLAATVRELARSIEHAAVRLLVADASDEHRRLRSEAVWVRSGLTPKVHSTTSSLLVAIQELVESAGSDIFCLQFDDTITVGLDPSWLSGAAQLLRHYRGQLDVVVPLWPVAVEADLDARVVRVTPHRRRGDRYRFWTGGWQEPARIEEIDGNRFGIFTNFAYGFHFNNLVGDTASFTSRLGWYRSHVSNENAHQIELAAFAGRGPTWPYIVVPLDGRCLLDLDYEHTELTVRGEAPERRQICEVLDAGGAIVVNVE